MSLKVHHRRTSSTVRELRSILTELPIGKHGHDEATLKKELAMLYQRWINVLSSPEPPPHPAVKQLAADIFAPELAMKLQAAAFSGAKPLLDRAHEDPPMLPYLLVAAVLNQGNPPVTERLNELHYYFLHFDEMESDHQARFLQGIYDSITENLINNRYPYRDKSTDYHYTHKELEQERINSPRLQLQSLSTLLMGCLLCLTNFHIHDLEIKAFAKLNPTHRMAHRRYVFNSIAQKVIGSIAHELNYREAMNAASSSYFAELLKENPALMDTIKLALSKYRCEYGYNDKHVKVKPDYDEGIPDELL